MFNIPSIPKCFMTTDRGSYPFNDSYTHRSVIKVGLWNTDGILRLTKNHASKKKTCDYRCIRIPRSLWWGIYRDSEKRPCSTNRSLQLRFRRVVMQCTFD